MQLDFSCPRCGAPRHLQAAENTTVLECPDCGYIGLLPVDWVSRGRVVRCPICGSDSLFRRREAGRKLPLALLLGGLVLGPPTRWISLLAAVAIAVLLWKRAPEALICYRCRARIRGHRPDPDHRPFDPGTEARVRGSGNPTRGAR